MTEYSLLVKNKIRQGSWNSYLLSTTPGWLDFYVSPRRASAVVWDASEASMPLPAFVEALERCIAELSATVSHTSTIWADHCESPGSKTQFQVLWHVKKAWHL